MRVCILGSGLSSLALAKSLVNKKIYVDVLYSKKTFLVNKTRTIGISKSNIEFFNEKIINIEKIIYKLNKIEIYSDNLENQKLINFGNNNDYLFSIVKNYKLQEILEKNLSRNKYFRKINYKKKLNYFRDFDLVFNTDYNNPITKKYFNKKIEKKYNSVAYTTILEHKKISNNIAVQIFTKNGPLAFLPISDSETSIVYSINNRLKGVKEVNNLINNYNFKYNLKKINKIDSFKLQGFSLRKYFHKNILAFGDLLHRIHPLAGQGFNMTIRDIKTLNDIIQKKIDLGLPLDSTLNTEFENNQKHKNYIFSKGIDLIHEFFNFERKTENDFLSKSIKYFNKNPSINKILTKIADKGLLF
ncbi:FAD-dependent monooxygenase [Candidatus Pelagibacter sp.]|nr:FAD-dependent monooxygenase [Candidatus Pelagibacter sp.]